MGSPPLLGVVQFSVTVWSPRFVVRFVGAEGTPSGVAVIGSDQALVPSTVVDLARMK